jgi:hypothetical protein
MLPSTVPAEQQSIRVITGDESTDGRRSRFLGGRVDARKFLARHTQNEDVDLAIRSKSGGEQVAAEISFVSLLKMIAEANCHHAARRACDLPLPGAPIVRW